MPHHKVILNTWPDSEVCCGCKHGLLIDGEKQLDRSGYICFRSYMPTEEGCLHYEDESHP